MRKFVFGILILLAIIFLVYWFFFRRNDADIADTPAPSPDVELDSQASPAPPGDQSRTEDIVSYSANLRAQNQPTTGQVRFLTAPNNQTLVTVVLSAPLANEEAAHVRLHSGTCDAVGDQVAQLARLSEYAAEGLVPEPASSLFPNGQERVVVLARPGAGAEYVLCGSVSRARTFSALTYPSLRRLAPSQTHQPANTGWAW